MKLLREKTDVSEEEWRIILDNVNKLVMRIDKLYEKIEKAKKSMGLAKMTSTMMAKTINIDSYKLEIISMVIADYELEMKMLKMFKERIEKDITFYYQMLPIMWQCLISATLLSHADSHVAMDEIKGMFHAFKFSSNASLVTGKDREDYCQMFKWVIDFIEDTSKKRKLEKS